ncbi:MAG: hypothetical protein ABJN26_15970 [Stappiaceae bacterium]
MVQTRTLLSAPLIYSDIRIIAFFTIDRIGSKQISETMTRKTNNRVMLASVFLMLAVVIVAYFIFKTKNVHLFDFWYLLVHLGALSIAYGVGARFIASAAAAQGKGFGPYAERTQGLMITIFKGLGIWVDIDK